MMPELPGAVPEIPVSDITAATTYYRDNLSFTRDHCRLFLAGPLFREERGNVGPVVTWLNLSSKAEVDDLYEAWRATNAVLLSARESKPWGLHEFTAADPDGNQFRVFYDFATPEREQAMAAANRDPLAGA